MRLGEALTAAEWLVLCNVSSALAHFLRSCQLYQSNSRALLQHLAQRVHAMETILRASSKVPGSVVLQALEGRVSDVEGWTSRALDMACNRNLSARVLPRPLAKFCKNLDPVSHSEKIIFVTLEYRGVSLSPPHFFEMWPRWNFRKLECASEQKRKNSVRWSSRSAKRWNTKGRESCQYLDKA